MHNKNTGLPRPLLVVLALLAVSVLFDLVFGFATGFDTKIMIRLTLAVILALGLYQGREAARLGAIALSGLGMIAGAFSGIVMVRSVTQGALSMDEVLVSGLLLFSSFVSFLMLAGGAIVIYCLSRHDVQAWMARRAFVAVDD